MNTRYKTAILLIEDNPADVDLVKEFLKDAAMKYELFQTETLYEGIELIHQTEIELVLLDLTLPDISGFKTLTNFLNQAPRIPVIILTGMNNEIIGNQAIKAGAQDFLVKGQFDGKLLGRVIRYSLQRFKAQLKLEESARELKIHRKHYIEAQEMAHFGHWEMDIVTNEMKWSDEVFRIFGFQPGKLAPKLSDYLSYVHLEDKKKVELFFEMVAKDGKLLQIEHRILVEGKTLKDVALQAKVYYDDITDKILLVGGLQDITDRKLSEKLIIEKKISSKAERIKEEALAEMGFHIRTPLSSIVNLLYLLENTRMNLQQTDYIKDLKTSVDDLSIAISNMLNFSVLVSDHIKVEEEKFNLRDLLKSIVQVVQIKADNAMLNLQFDIEEQLPENFLGDTKKITQILFNLMDNAIKYSPKGGRIVVEAGMKDLQASRLKLILRVKDTGRGMSRSKIKELLKSDELLKIHSENQVDGEAKESLGIAIASKLSQTLGGTLNIFSKEGKGSEFSITIPLKIAKETTFFAGDAPEAPLKILLIEDHFLNQIATKKVLTTWSDFVTVDIAENGLIGVEKFREHGYDLILMDIQMPVMNGIDAARKIRENSDVPIIALTANSTKQEQDKCFEIGMNDYLAKPFQPKDLYAKIMALIALVMN